ncbi:MAG: hypothetical protein LBI55_00850 [Oscillospiraceae bacterium]|nr:hypothetical protein [Oscillospiraceae bacterium]
MQLQESYTIDISQNPVKNKDIFSFLENYDDEIFLLKDGGGIYFNKKISLIQEMDFKDFLKLEDISEKKNLFFKNTYKENQDKNLADEIFINSASYNLGGTFRSKFLPQQIYILFSGNSDELHFLNDRFILWTRGDTGRFLEDMGKFLDSMGGEKTKMKVTKNPGLENLFFLKLRENFTLAMISFLIMIVLLLNSVNSIKYWLEKQKIKFGVKRLCGASALGVLREIVLQYSIIMCLSFLVGAGAFDIVKNLPMFANKEMTLFLDSFLISFALCFTGGLLTVLPIFFGYCKKHVVGMLR